MEYANNAVRPIRLKNGLFKKPQPDKEVLVLKKPPKPICEYVIFKNENQPKERRKGKRRSRKPKPQPDKEVLVLKAVL